MIGDRKQIRLEKWTTTKDSKKNNVESITKIIDTWADIKRIGGDRNNNNGQTSLTNMYEFTVRYGSIDPVDITSNWRIIYDRRYFKIHSCNKKKEDRFYYIIRAEAKGAR